MTEPDVGLALGTAQFGTAYGVAGRGEVVPLREVRAILDAAWHLGVKVLDTAPAYGEIEQQLSEVIGQHPFSIVSKISALPEQESSDTAGFVRNSISRSRQRLGDRLSTVLFHRMEDLLGDVGAAAWEIAHDQTMRANIRLGASCYSPREAVAMRERYPLAAVQLPGNVLDQRLGSQDVIQELANIEIHLRSVFLQGLLLLPLETAVRRLPAAESELRNWAKWCSDQEIAPLRAALSVVKAMPGVRYCVVGVDGLTQLEEIVAAWNDTQPLDSSSLSCSDENIIDPRRWSIGGA